MAEKLKLEFKGPFYWMADDEEKSILYSDLSKKFGLYLWTIHTREHGDLILYVGETIWSFRVRMGQHLEKQLAGSYAIYDPDLLISGIRKPLWHGMFGRSIKERITDYIKRLDYFVPLNMKNIQSAAFYIAEADPAIFSKRILQRIEAKIAYDLSQQEDMIKNFKEPFRTWPRRADETPLELTLEWPESLIGLSTPLTV